MLMDVTMLLNVNGHDSGHVNGHVNGDVSGHVVNADH